MEDHIEPAGWALGLSGLALLVGAWIAYATGEPAGGDAALVLGVLGVVLLGNALAVISYGREALRRRDGDTRAAALAAEDSARRAMGAAERRRAGQ